MFHKITKLAGLVSLPILRCGIYGKKMENLKNRKTPRFKDFDYNTAGAYFITVCTQNRRLLLSRIVGTNVKRANNPCSQFISTFKRFCNKEYGENIWQARFNDHIIRDHKEYEGFLKYIYENPTQWLFDELYSEV